MADLYFNLTERGPTWDSPYGTFRLWPVLRDDATDKPAMSLWHEETDRRDLRGLVISCQWNRGEGEPYAQKAYFDRIEVSTVDRARELGKVLGKIERGLKRFEERFGAAETFGAFAQRVGMVLGAAGFCHASEGCYHSESGYRFRPLAELPAWLAWRLESIEGGNV